MRRGEVYGKREFVSRSKLILLLAETKTGSNSLYVFLSFLCDSLGASKSQPSFFAV